MTETTGLDAALLTRHIATLRRLGGRSLRQGYLADVERNEGPEFAEKLKKAFTADWERRKVKE